MRARLVLGSGLFFALAPATVAGLVPYLLTGWQVRPAFAGWVATRYVGGALAAAGWVVLIEAFVRFARVGRGTPAPVAPPSRLVVSGFYRFVRNPMYVAVIAAILGTALVFGSARLVVYAGAVWLLFDLFVRFYEEPTLGHQFGVEYLDYCARVPRWLPRATGRNH